jgi:hypothetical protein
MEKGEGINGCGRVMMIVELRTYTFQPGGVALFLKSYQAGPLDLQRSILGNLLGYFVADTGTLNQTVHMWGFDSLQDRAARRAELAAHPNWQTFLESILPLLQKQESKILLPTAFSPTELRTPE